MTLRRLALQVHLWSSLAFALFIVIACVSGSALVYRHDIDRALNPSLYRTTPGDVGWDAIWNTVGTRYSLGQGALIRGPVDRGVYQVEIGDDLLPFAVHVDPGSGAILGARNPADSLAGWLFLLHFNLFGGEAGHQVVGATGVVLVLITLTGIWLWWPTIRRLAFGFRIRWARPFFVVNYDLHRVIGICSLPLVLVVSLTGAMLVFYEVGGRLLHALFLTTPAAAAPILPPGLPDTDGAALPLTLNAAAAVAARLAPDAVASSMYIPAPATEPVKVWLRTPGDTRPNVGSWHAQIDRSTGTVISAMLPQNSSWAAHIEESWIVALHFGTFGGNLVRLLYAAGGLVPAILLVTGTVHWWLRRRPGAPVRSTEAESDLTDISDSLPPMSGNSPAAAARQPVALCDLRAGDSARFLRTEGDPDTAQFLRVIGLTHASELRLCQSGDPCIIQVRSTRIGLSRTVAQRVFVVPVPEPRGEA